MRLTEAINYFEAFELHLPDKSYRYLAEVFVVGNQDVLVVDMGWPTSSTFAFHLFQQVDVEGEGNEWGNEQGFYIIPYIPKIDRRMDDCHEIWRSYAARQNITREDTLRAAATFFERNFVEYE